MGPGRRAAAALACAAPAVLWCLLGSRFPPPAAAAAAADYATLLGVAAPLFAAALSAPLPYFVAGAPVYAAAFFALAASPKVVHWVYYAANKEKLHNPCAASQPLLSPLRADFLNGSELGAVRAWADELRQGRHGAGRAWQLTRDGLDELYAAPGGFGRLRAYLDRILLAEANGFVVNLLVTHPSDTGGGGEFAGLHVDDTYAVPGALSLPRETTVLYLEVPAGMLGGELAVWGAVGAGRWPPWGPGVPLLSNLDPAPTLVAPRRNAVATFRGDAYHSVRPYAAARGEPPRVSLVVEQHAVPLPLAGRARRFRALTGDLAELQANVDCTVLAIFPIAALLVARSRGWRDMRFPPLGTDA